MLARVSLTAANRPELLPDESLLFVQPNVGLYEGKNKLPNHQNGFAYLTTHRAAYVDNAQPRKYSVAVELKDVDRVEPYAGFLKSSPKITLHLKVNATGSASSTNTSNIPSTPSPTPPQTVTWICPICSFSNPLPSNHVPGLSEAPSCLTCGIKPSPSILTAALNAPPPPPSSSTCPRCTFHNHPSLSSCEICGASLISTAALLETSKIPSNLPPPQPQPPVSQIIKFSFRGGGHGSFLTHLRSALIQRKWLLHSAPPIPRPPPPLPNPPSHASAGIAGLESTISARRNTAIQTLGSGAFEDIDSLRAHGKDLIALAESFKARFNSTPGDGDTVSSSLARSASDITQHLNLISKDQLPSGDEAGWIDELSRQVADFLLTNKILQREGGVMTLIDVFAVLNRARAGIDLISPSDLKKAVDRFSALKLPVRCKKMKSGLVVVRDAGRTEEVVARQVREWLGWDMGVTVRDAAEKFGWSLGVAQEELEEAERRGWVCREVGIEGVRFWGNRFLWRRGEEEEEGAGEG
ncbi:Vps36-domain-containing protein [Ascodesmis nigricans]|uniref:Vacuolar protein-sorting-associated protein 36 n=1 Tax=Ascodesmis nigricans TaxID=341454 RepID=A0A4V3SJI0_9PEZI|nr:Vps36-domain-containing protein [Ascodesmis nigricans]